MRYRGFIFDFDYTLADSSAGIIRCFRTVLGSHGHEQPDDYAIKRTIAYSISDGFTMLTGITDPDILRRYADEYRQEADRVMVRMTKLYPAVPDAFRAVKAAGAAIGIVSSKLRSRIMPTLEEAGIAEMVSVIIGTEDITAYKPDPDGLNKAVARMGLSAGEILYIGDSVVDAVTAENAGADFAGVLTGVTAPEELKAHPHRALMKDLTELGELFLK